jgi:predicted HicB family RNase H-like nuclease
MNTIMVIDGREATVTFDVGTGLYRGEFVKVRADFYAPDLDALHREGEISLRVYLEECARRGIEE